MARPTLQVPFVLQDQATEVILTLGQAFEVAYQMALRDQFTGGRGGNGNSGGGYHVRSLSAVPNTSHPWTNSSSQSNHFRSLSVNEIKVNGRDETNDVPPPQQGPSGKKDEHDEAENPASGHEAADVMNAETSKGSQVSEAPIVLTEEL
jgi:hypothetical protein